ncbi:MAG: hypothetical protein LUF35_07225, partial [Lachnospiraceae bacterium]|nr:hypothetical protein [Lachnospiraceae bacterium]
TEGLEQQRNPGADTEGLVQQSNPGTDTEDSLVAGASSEIWNTLDFTRFFWYMRQLFIIREDGRYDFSHAGIRESYKNWCLRDQREERTDRKYTGNQQQECADGILSAQQTENTDELSEEPEKKLHIQILYHLKNRLEETDPIRINEFVYHCRHADDKAAFVEYGINQRK